MTLMRPTALVIVLYPDAAHSADEVVVPRQGIPDPAGQPVEAVRPTRDDIAERVRSLITELLPTTTTTT